MKRKVMSVLLSAAMIMSLMVGCGSTETASKETETTAPTSAVTNEATTETAQVTDEASTTDETSISGELNIIHYLTETAKVAALDELVQGFSAEYPDVTVNVEAMAMDNYSDVVKLRFSTDEAPDVIFGQPKSYTDLIDNGLIKDLTGEDFVSRLSESSTNCVTYNGGVYGVALDQMANVVFYNKDIFTKQGLSVPTTYTEFIATCKALKDAGITPCAAGYQDDIALGANWYTIYYGSKWNQAQNNAQELMDGASLADYTGYSEALDQWREIMVNYQNDDCKTIDTARAEQMFANGETAMIIIGTWGLGAILDYNPNGNFGGFMYPSENTADECYVPVSIDDTWMVSEDTQNEEAALAFLEYATRSDVNSKWCGTASQLSALVGVECDTLPEAAKDIANEIATKKTTAWSSISNFTGQYSTVYTNSLRDFAVDDKMTDQDFIKEMDDGFAAARK